MQHGGGTALSDQSLRSRGVPLEMDGYRPTSRMLLPRVSWLTGLPSYRQSALARRVIETGESASVLSSWLRGDGLPMPSARQSRCEDRRPATVSPPTLIPRSGLVHRPMRSSQHLLQIDLLRRQAVHILVSRRADETVSSQHIPHATFTLVSSPRAVFPGAPVGPGRLSLCAINQRPFRARRSPIPLLSAGFPGAAADLPRSTLKGSASKLRPLG